MVSHIAHIAPHAPHGALPHTPWWVHAPALNACSSPSGASKWRDAERASWRRHPGMSTSHGDLVGMEDGKQCV